MAIIKLNNNALTSVTTINSLTSLPSGLGSDPNVKIDLARLGLRVFANQNLAKQNSTSLSYDVFEDSTGVENLSNTTRQPDEFMSTSVVGTPVQLDYFNPVQAGGGTSPYQVKLSYDAGSVYTALRETYIDIPTTGTSGYRTIDADYAQANGSYPIYVSNLGESSYVQYDYKEVKNFSGGFKYGKAPTWGDLNQSRIQYSTDDATYTNLDLSGASVSGTNPIYSGTGYSGGTLGSFGSDGTLSMTAFTPAQSYGVQNAHAHVDTGVPNFSARYIRIQFLSKHSFTAVGCGIFTPYLENLTVNPSGTFEGTAITASSTDTMGAVISYKNNAGTNVLNTDIVLQLSADNGSNYTTATLVDNGNLDSVTKVASVSDVSVTAGTQLKYKISFANQVKNSKDCRVTGVSLQF